MTGTASSPIQTTDPSPETGVGATPALGDGSGAVSPTGAGSQTLSRGIRILEILADHGGPMPFADIVTAAGFHRSIAYRLMRTLEDHGLVVRDVHGTVSLGNRLAALAASVERDVQQQALPALRAAADDLAATCFIVSFEADEVTTLISAPPGPSVVAVAQNPGTKHPLGIGAPGRAILAQLPAAEWPEELTREQRRQTADVLVEGFAVSHDEVYPGLHALAVPMVLPGRQPLALGVACLAIVDPIEQIVARLRHAAKDVAIAIGA